MVLSLCALVLTGCSRSDDSVAHDTSQPTTTTTTPRKTPPDIDATSPHSYAEVMARLPRFDEPASREVAAWRRASISAFFGRCGTHHGGADMASFVRANRRALSQAAVFPGARLVGEDSIGQRDGNGCPDGSGPATYYTTFRTYRLPAGTKPAQVFAHYERQLPGWVEASITSCERTYGQGPAYIAVRACNGKLRLGVRARGPVDSHPRTLLPPRPLGLQYPIASGYSAAPKATRYSAAPGTTCERVSGTSVPSVIVPPPPGIRAEIRGDTVIVTWDLGKVHGDCPPSALAFTVRAATMQTFGRPVHRATGVTRIQLSGSAPPTRLTAKALSVDGTLSRPVAVLVRRS